MIIQEPYMIRSDGVQLIRFYSDLDFYMQDNSGNVYTEAIDPEGMNRQYHEIPITIHNSADQQQEELQEAIQILFGSEYQQLINIE